MTATVQPAPDAPAQPRTLRPPALAGMRVVDFSHFVAGPLASQLLGDWGAEVIKIENPLRGDEFRHYPPYDERLGGEGCPFLWTNRNKKSFALDLKSPEGLRAVRELIRKADVVLENFSTGVMERLGFGYEKCAEDNPGLVYCSVSAYGRDGPFADRIGFDPVVQAESGFISLTGYPDRDGVRAGPIVVDIGTALIASNAILLGLLERSRSGLGQQVSTAMFDSAMTMLGFGSYQSIFNGVELGRSGNTSQDTAPTGVFHASDGPMYIACTSTPAFQRLFTLIGKEEMANDPVLITKQGRLLRRQELFDTINTALATHTREEWQARFREARVPSGIVRTVREAVNSGESVSRGLFTTIPHPTAGQVPNLRSPIRMEGSAMVDPVAAPILGQHTEAILEGLGYSAAQIDEMRRAGVFGDTKAQSH